MTYLFYKNDLPNDLDLGNEIAIDTEALGLNNFRDRLCMIQICKGDNTAYIVQFDKDNYNSPNLIKLLQNENILKIMHYARFDMAILQKTFGFQIKNVYCTKIASKIARTYTDAHGLKALVKELIDIEISKREGTSYWGGNINEEQLKYAANDVLFLHRIKTKLNDMLEKEGRRELAYDCFKFLNTRVDLDLNGWLELDIFSH